MKQSHTLLTRGEHTLSLTLFDNEQLDHVIELTEPQTSVSIAVKVRAEQDTAPQLQLRVIHRAPNTHANVQIKTLAQGNAQPKLSGILEICPKAPGCTSYLTHNNLVFDRAHVWTQPALEIHNNEVACSHAATVHTITPSDLFYLQTRGIPEAEARATLIRAFLA